MRFQLVEVNGERIKLKSCPFCGCNDQRVGGSIESQWFISCEECDAYGPPHKDLKEAARRWNRDIQY